MASRDIIVVGGSAGGVEALQTLVRMLPPHLPATVLAVLHFPEKGTSLLPRILSRAGPLAAVHAADGDHLVPGRIYVAPPDRHLLVTEDGIKLGRGPTENGNRPAIDPLFRSAASTYGPRVIGVLLTGNLDDGTSGLAAVKRYGGLAVVQDPEDALFPSMPRSAIEHVHVDRVVPLRQMAKVLQDLIETPIPATDFDVSRDDLMENEFSAGDLEPAERAEQHPGTPSTFGCPDCGGVLWELREGEFVRFRCRVGHAWSGDALLDEQARQFDEALWIALRTLEERAALSRKIADRHRARGSDRLAARFDAQAGEIEKRAAIVHAALSDEPNPGPHMDADRDGPRRAS
jgi:two-component system chemotaxis response regulator CheB